MNEASDITLLEDKGKQFSFVKLRMIAAKDLDTLTTCYTQVSGEKSRSSLLSR